MTGVEIQRRRGGPIVAVVVDLVHHARHTRNWAILIVAVLIALAVAIGASSQAALPFVVYGGL